MKIIRTEHKQRNHETDFDESDMKCCLLNSQLRRRKLGGKKETFVSKFDPEIESQNQQWKSPKSQRSKLNV